MKLTKQIPDDVNLSDESKPIGCLGCLIDIVIIAACWLVAIGGYKLAVLIF